MDEINPKLLKIIALAKAGIGGERTAAIELVHKICDREGLNFDEVMSDTAGDMPHLYEFDIKIRTKDEYRIALQVICRFGLTEEYPDIKGGYYRGYREVFFKYTATATRHIETLNAIDIYLKTYRKEKKNILEALKDAYVAKHNLYPQFDLKRDDEPPRERTDEERRKTWRTANVMQGLTESVNLQKQIGGGHND